METIILTNSHNTVTKQKTVKKNKKQFDLLGRTDRNKGSWVINQRTTNQNSKSQNKETAAGAFKPKKMCLTCSFAGGQKSPLCAKFISNQRTSILT